MRPRPVPVELSGDAGFAARVRRLTATSVVGLGLVFALWAATLDTAPWVGAALLGGWLLMPSLLALSIRRPRVRYGLVIPSSLVGLALLTVCVRWLPDDAVAAAGWLALTAGVLLGGFLGVWFWFRLLPVPGAFEQPFSPARWALVTAHVGLVVAGLVAVTVAAL